MATTNPAAACITFSELMTLETVKSDGDNAIASFMAKHKSPNLGAGGGYGGFVFAQSAWAAAQTVETDMTVHNIHGYFTLPAHTDRPIFYDVQVLSSGRSFCTRIVTARQPVVACSFPFDVIACRKELGKVCFMSMCSFRKDEVSTTSHSIKANLKEKYDSVLKQDPDEHDPAPKIDTPLWRAVTKSHPHLFVNDFPGLDIRKVEMSAFNMSKAPEDQKQLTYYRPYGLLRTNLPNLHACAHLYASDRNSLFLISNSVGFGDQVGKMGTLSHSVVFHVNSQDLILNEEDWWCQEAWTSRSEGGRGMHESHMWKKDETLIASTWQDGLVRKEKEDIIQQQRAGWIDGIRKSGMINTKIADLMKGSKL